MNNNTIFNIKLVLFAVSVCLIVTTMANVFLCYLFNTIPLYALFVYAIVWTNYVNYYTDCRTNYR